MMHTCLDHGHDCSFCEDVLDRQGEIKRAQERVESWNWNLNIFEIYDEIRDEDEYEQRLLLRTALRFFKDKTSRSGIRELAYHLDVDLEGCDDEGHENCDHECEIYNCEEVA